MLRIVFAVSLTAVLTTSLAIVGFKFSLVLLVEIAKMIISIFIVIAEALRSNILLMAIWVVLLSNLKKISIKQIVCNSIINILGEK
jgi:hypothetical protein